MAPVKTIQHTAHKSSLQKLPKNKGVAVFDKGVVVFDCGMKQ